MLFDTSPSSQVRFVKLTDYCVAEFILEPLASSIFTTQDYLLLTNSFNSTNQVYNIDGALNLTGNIKDLTVVNTSNNIAAYLDSEKVPNYTVYDPTLNEVALSSYTVVTDTIKFHFMTGFDFQDLSGVVLTVKMQMNDGNFLILANILLSPLTFDSILRYDSKPLFLNGVVYDRFVIIKVPSVKNINNDFYTSMTPAITFAYAATSGKGLVQDIPITIALSESDFHTTIFGTNSINYDGYEISHYYEAKVAQTNDLDDLGAVIQEASDGDYIEYYASWNGGFPDELIVLLDKRGSDQDWDIIHQLTVFEQVGSDFISSGPYTIYQDSNFDIPLKFRPILDNASEAISVSIDYLMRLYNKLTGDQEIRNGSVTITNPNKYGKQLSKIQLSGDPMSQKIYNKIFQKSYDSTLLFIESANQGVVLPSSASVNPPTTITKVQYVPMFYQYNSVMVAEKSLMITNSDDSQIIAFGQGKLPIIIQPFDNIFKFKVYTLSGSTQVPFSLNLNSTIRMVFNSSQNPLTFSNLNDSTKENLSEGEVAFKISRDNALTILAFPDRVFYLTVLASDGTETTFYSGKWYMDSERDTVSALYQTETVTIQTNNQTDASIQAIDAKITDQAAITSTSNGNSTNPSAGSSVNVPGFVPAGATANSTTVVQQISPLSSTQNSQ